MVSCELCGKDTELMSALVEGIALNVCKSCARHGKVLARPRAKPKPLKQSVQEPVDMLVDNFADKVRRAREQLGLTQKEFARKLNEKESVLQKIETNHFRPTIEKARHFERVLGVTLVESSSVEPVVKQRKSDSGGLTIGDMLKL